jgi:KDO2-lipid IV(A) lauroyltransferase
MAGADGSSSLSPSRGKAAFPPWLYRAGRGLGRLTAALDVAHRRVVRRNLAFAYPGCSPPWVRALTGEVFAHMGMAAAEILQMARMGREELLGAVSTSGEEHLRRALEAGRGLIIVSAHLGNWEMALQYASCYFRAPVNVVAKPMRSRALNDRLHRFRTRFGARVIYKEGSLPEMAQALRRREIVCLLVDQSRRSEGLECRFMGHRVTTTPAVAMLALRHRSPVLPIFCIRRPEGGLHIQAEPQVPAGRTGSLRADMQAITQRITEAVERMVRRYPEQWLWAHKRWKKFHPELYPEYQALRRRRHRHRG